MSDTQEPAEDVTEAPTAPVVDPELLRQAQIQLHNQQWENVNWQAPQQVNGTHIVQDALDQLGQPHQWGGNQPGGFDSQGLAKYVYQNNGLPMSHMIHNQMQHGEPISLGQLQPGDLVFVATGSPQVPDRTGVYTGNGIMVHSAPGVGVVASRVSHIGTPVGAMHLQSVVRHGTAKPQPVPPNLYQTDEVMPHNRLPAALKTAATNVAKGFE